MGTTLMISLIIILMDQLSKFFILQNLSIGASITVIPNFFFITHIRNSGAAWGFLANQDWGISLLSIISIVVSLFLIYLLYINDLPVFRILIAIILGGSVGNLIDRIRFNNVVDFLSFKFGNYYFPVFNIADISIVLGGIAVFIYFIRQTDKLEQITFWKKSGDVKVSERKNKND